MPIRGKGGKGRGGRSKTRREGTVPGVPTGVTATDVGTNRPYNNGAVTVTFTAASDGSTPATSYTASGFCSVHNTTHTVTGASSPLTITGFGSGVSTTITVKANNQYGSSADSSPSSSVTVTTVPATPSAPSASSPSAGTDSVSWSAPANGGKAITNYYWTSSDSKSGNTTSTSVSVAQEQGTAQTYNVRADNANGSSGTSANSGSVTTTFSFTPFSVFSFSPFGVFSFSPFGVFSFSPFGFSPFSFSPFGFSPFGFSPFSFSPFGFSPFGFSPFAPLFGPRIYSLSPHTKVRMADGTLKEAQDIVLGDELMSVILPGLGDVFTTESLAAWSTSEDISDLNTVSTTVNRIKTHTSETLHIINGDSFSPSHLVLVKTDNDVSMKKVSDIVETDFVWSQGQWNEITTLEVIEYQNNVININCEPYDIFFTENALTHDGAEYYNN